MLAKNKVLSHNALGRNIQALLTLFFAFVLCLPLVAATISLKESGNGAYKPLERINSGLAFHSLGNNSHLDILREASNSSTSENYLPPVGKTSLKGKVHLFVAADAPTALVAKPGVGSAHISFTEPASNGGFPIINYEYSLDGGAWVAFDPEAESGAVTIEDLTNYTSYSVKLRAVTTEGAGAGSVAVEVTPVDGQPEGITWTKQAFRFNGITTMTYGNGLFVAFSSTGKVITSPDGITWTSQSPVESNYWTSVTYGNGLFVAVANSGLNDNKVMTSPDGITWTKRNSPAGDNWNSVTYGNGLFVAVARRRQDGGADQVMTSPDGIVWTVQLAAARCEWKSITYGNDLFVAVAYIGTFDNIKVMTSPDGINWTKRNSPVDDNWQSVTYGNRLFVALGQNSKVMTSPDGIIWTEQSSEAGNLWNSVTYGNGLFVAVSSDGIVMTSRYGVNWTTRAADQNTQFRSVTYGNGQFLVANNRGVETSSAYLIPNAPVIDGITVEVASLSVAFSQPASPDGSAINNYEYSIDNGANWITVDPVQTSSPLLIKGLTWSSTYQIRLRSLNVVVPSLASEMVVATTLTPVAADAPTELSPKPGVASAHISFTEPASNGFLPINNYEYSLDGGAWVAFDPEAKSGAVTIEDLTNNTSYSVRLRAITEFGPGVESAAVSVSPKEGEREGITWTTQAAPKYGSWFSATYGNGLFVALDYDGLVMTSPDGITWTSITAPEADNWRSVTYGNGLFVAVSANDTNQVMTSPDGSKWTLRDASTGGNWLSVTYGNGLFVAVAFASTNRVMTSPDGVNWKARDAEANSWLSVTYGNDLFVAVSNAGGKVMTSPDGIVWTAGDSALANLWKSITYGNGLFVAVSTDGNVMTSPDGETWTAQTAAAASSWRSVTYGNGLYVAVSGDGINRVMTSQDGINWISRATPEASILLSVTYGNGIFVAPTSDKVMRSEALLVPDAPIIDEITSGLYSLSVAFSPGSPGGSPISNYEHSIDNGANWITRNPALTTSPLLIDGLNYSTTYQVQMRAVNSHGISFGSGMKEATTTTPVAADAPTALLEKTGVNSSHISFTEPASNGGVPINNYEYSIDEAVWIAFDPAAKSGAVTIEGLTNDESYSVRLRAVTAFGSGAESELIAVAPKSGQKEGITWTSQTAAAANWLSVTYGNGLFVAVSDNGANRVMTSSDGIDWTARVAEANSWRSVTYGNGLFVAVAATGTNRVMTSSDGIDWTARGAAEANSWRSVTYGNGLFVAVSDNGANRVMTSPDGITWTARGAAEANSWRSVTYGNELFVAVSNTGTNRVMTSPDGIVWTARDSAPANSWVSITYGYGLFVAVSTDGNVVASPDGESWTAQTATAANSWSSVTYGNGLFVAIGEDGINRVMTSPDGIDWTARAASEANAWASVTYGNGLFVAVSSNGTNKVMTSEALFVPNAPVINGITAGAFSLSVAFSQPASSGDALISNYEYSTDNGKIWITRNPALTTSPLVIDGLNNPTTYQILLRSLNVVVPSLASEMVEATTITPEAAYAPTALSAKTGVESAHISFTEPASNGGLPINNYEYSLDGGAWVAFDPEAKSGAVTIEDLTNNTSYSVRLRAITEFGPGVESAPVSVSPKEGEKEGIAWTSQTAAAANWLSVTYGNGLFVAIAEDGINRVMTSPDGIDWTARVAEANSWRSVTYGNGLFVAVAATGTNRVMTSSDGIDWTARGAAEANSWRSVTYGNGLFVAIAEDGINRVMTSPDGITWTPRGAAEANSWRSVTYGNELFVAVAFSNTNNRVMTSVDGINWTAQTVGASYLLSVTYGKGLFVAVSYNKVMTSPDGEIWTDRAPSAAYRWTSVSYGNGLFVAVSANGTDRVMTSPDGEIWTARASSAANSWTSVTYGNGLFVAVASGGTKQVMTSEALFIPDAPAIGAITAGSNILSVAFSQPVSSGGPSISNYEYSIDNGENWITFYPVQTISPLLIKGLTPNTTYQIRLRSLNVVVPSVGSAMMEASTLDPGPAAAPIALSAKPGVGSAHISFTEPADNGGFTIINYEYSLDEGEWVTFESGAVTIENLTNCTIYSVKLRAITSFGAGTKSEAVLVTPKDGEKEGTTWEARTGAVADSYLPWNSVTYGNGLYVAIAALNGNVMTSTDGFNWTLRRTPTSLDRRSVTYGNGLFVAVSYGGSTSEVMTSPDGITWMARAKVVQDRVFWASVTYGNGLFVAVAATGTKRVMTSSDGIDWTARDAADASSWSSVTYGNGLFVAVAVAATGENRHVMTSPDGETWTGQTAAAANPWRSVTYGNGLFVAVANNAKTGTDRVMTSPDGVTWTARAAAEANSWLSVTYGNGLFVAVATNGTNRVMTSPDGISWEARTASVANDWTSVTYGNGLFVAVSANGTNKVMTSEALFSLGPDSPVIDVITPSLNSLSVAFTPPVSEGASAISNYEYSIDNGLNWVTLDPAQTTGPIEITELEDARTYQVQLRSVDDQGVSCGSVMVEGRTLGDRNLTITVDTGQTKPYGTAEPVLTYKATGFVDGDDESILKGSLVRDKGEDVDTYTINQGSVDAGFKYVIDFISDNFEITKADAVITVNPYDEVYDGEAHTSTFTAVGDETTPVDLSDLMNVSGTTHTNAGDYTEDAWTFAGNENYNEANGTVDNNIKKADAVIVVNTYDVTYDAKPHTSTFTAVGDETTPVDLSDLMNVSGTTHTNAGDYTEDAWTFAGNENFNEANGTVDNNIKKADAVIVVNPYDVTYDAKPHTSTFTAVGDETTPVDLSDLMNVSGTTHTNAGDYTEDAWTFAGNENYNEANGTVDNNIKKADAVIVVNPYDVTYDAKPHTSTGTATGVSSESLTGLDLSATTHTSAGDYTGYAWTFTDVTGNYNDDSGTVDNNIKKKPITVSVDVGQSKYCGQIDPDFTYTLSEPLLPDNSFTGGLSRIPLDESVGIYAYTDGDLSAGMNYSLTLNETNNTFQIKSITIDASASGTPVQIGTSANLSATVSPGVGGVSVIFVVTNQAGVPVFTSEPDVTNSSGIATVDFNRRGITIGVFTVTATAGSGCASSIAYIPVYDPTLNQLTGGGWIDSPQGSFAEDPAQTGKANFGFVFESISVSNSKKGPPSPVAGNGEFQFNAGSLNFKSTLPEAGKLVIANNTGEYQGDGSLNGSTGYTFILTAVDGDLKRGTDPDMFRIQIWGANGVIYDNGLNSNGKSGGTTALGGGAILILETQGKNRREIDPEFIEVAWNTPIASVEKQISEFGGKWFEGRKINMTIDPEAYNPLIPGLYELKVGIAENEWIELADQITVNVLVSAKPKALDIMFSNETIAMNTEKGTLIGILSTKDPIDAIHSYRIESSQVKVEGDRVIWIGEGAVPKVVSFVVFSMDRAGQEISKEIVMFRELDPNTVMLYPNPASKETNIQIGINEESKVEIRIFDSVGRLVFEETSIVNQSFTQRVNLEGLSSGMYTVQVQINYQVITKRLIKK